MKTNSNSLKSKESTPLKNSEDENDTSILESYSLGNGPDLSVTKNSSDSTKEKQGTEGTQSLKLNVAHLLLLHGLVKNLHEHVEHNPKMQDFLHDLLIMFQIYLDSSIVPEEMKEKFNYSPK